MGHADTASMFIGSVVKQHYDNAFFNTAYQQEC